MCVVFTWTPIIVKSLCVPPALPGPWSKPKQQPDQKASYHLPQLTLEGCLYSLYLLHLRVKLDLILTFVNITCGCHIIRCGYNLSGYSPIVIVRPVSCLQMWVIPAQVWWRADAYCVTQQPALMGLCCECKERSACDCGVHEDVTVGCDEWKACMLKSGGCEMSLVGDRLGPHVAVSPSQASADVPRHHLISSSCSIKDTQHRSCS